MRLNAAADLVDFPPAQSGDRSQEALAFVQRVLAASSTEPFDLSTALAELARAFGADGAGLAGMLGSTPAVLHWAAAEVGPLATFRRPWEEWPERLPEILRTPTATCVRGLDGKVFLVTAFAEQEGTSWLHWLEGGKGEWTPEERATYTLAALVLSRLVTTQPAAASWRSWLDRARRQQRLDSAAAIVSRLVHDFNNVLTSVLGFTEISLARASRESASYPLMVEAYEAAKRGSALLRRFGVFGRRGTARPEKCDLGAITAEMQTRFQQGTGIEFVVDVAAGFPLLAVEPESLRVALTHLVDNAREASSAPGTIVLSARQTDLTRFDCVNLLGNASPGPFAEVAVADTGIGLSPEARQRLLAELFFSTKGHHRGLGLAIVYGIVHSYGGGIRFDPNGEQGTVARVYFPLVTAEPPTVLIRCGARRTTHREKLLVVDDDPQILRFISAILEQAGYRVESASSGPQALHSIASAAEPFRLMVTDIVMPEMNGFDLAESLQATHPHLPVLFTSGRFSMESVPEPYVNRVFDVLSKPFGPQKLLTAVQAALEQSSASVKHTPTVVDGGNKT